MNIARAGDRGLLVTLGAVDASTLHARAASVRNVPGVVACVPGHSSLLVLFDGVPERRALELALQSPASAAAISSRRLEIPVAFDGDDLPEFLDRVRISRDAFLSRVDQLRLTARYLGFRGGFAYLDGWPEEWAMPRRPTSRARVAAGTFAIAGGVAAFYPIDSPGGWNLLGHTSMDLQYAIEAGDEIRIVVARATVRTPTPPQKQRGFYGLSAPLGVVVERAEWKRLARGMSPGGPFDPLAAALANRAVGNPEDEAVLECAMTGPRGRLPAGTVAAWCDPQLNVEWFDDEIAIGRVANGLRGYLAIGSQRVAVQRASRSDRLTIEAIAGPHETPIRELECEVTPQLDRVGVRLKPVRPLDVAPPGDLASIGVQFGSLQLHPDGSVIAMGPDHPVTGGYLQPMTVISSECWKLGQLAPGDRVRFVAHSPSE